jgi:Xaa-Pro aminopeptidase
MQQEFSERRRRVLAALGDGMLIVPAAPVAIRNNDVEHEYRQDSDFFYLTGYDEPDSVLVLSPSSEQPFVMFVRPRDPEREVWDGARAGVEGAVRDFGADVAHPISELATKLPELMRNVKRVFYRLGFDRSFDDKILDAISQTRRRCRNGGTWPTEIVDSAVLLHELRLKKTEHELALMQRAAEITHEAHVLAMAASKPGMYEYEVEGLLRRVFRERGAERPAYAPIVGSGPNATVLHYRRSNRRMGDGDLLLIDAGCEYEYYACDVTRTFPVNGKFSPAQRAIYEIVLAAQLASIDVTKPGATLDEIHQASVRTIAAGLLELGILQGPLEAILEEQRYKPYYMHRTSHYLGMDVHDVGAYHVGEKPRELATGTVITVEPGIYISASAGTVPEEFRGIGIRIEDDVVVSADGNRVLTASIPKTVEDIERACAA